jgi:predicted aspartyl protease
MTLGHFGDGELFFEIQLVAANGEQFIQDALFDTGFTTGWLGINSQDLEALEWQLIMPKIEMQTARGLEFFDLYEGKVIIDDREYIIPVHAAEELNETLIGSLWLDMMQLIVNKPQGILRLDSLADNL